MILADLTDAQLERLAAEAGTSKKYLKHIIAGRREASLRMAVRLETAAKKFKWSIGRETLTQDCNRCPYFRACKKEK